jgi:hypothetical protein
MSQVFNNEVQAVFTGFLKQQKIKEKLTPTLKPLLGGRSGAGLYTDEHGLEDLLLGYEKIHNIDYKTHVTAVFCL